jgi:hypothetical protein
MSLPGCKSICGPHGSLWPRPKSVRLTKSLLDIQIESSYSESVILAGPASDDVKVQRFIRNAWEIFLAYFSNETKEQTSQEAILKVRASHIPRNQ